MSEIPQPQYNVGDRVYSHEMVDEVTIDSIQLTAQRQLRYLYKTDSGATGVATEAELGDPPTDNLDAPDILYINLCSVTDILNSFPNLPGGKGVLARKMVKAAKETPFDNEINFIDRMLEIEPKVEWEVISSRLKFNLPQEVGA